jgi:hypothetical protein
VFRVRRLETQHVLAKFPLMQPFGNEPSQSPLAFRRMVMGIAMKRVTGKGRCALAGDDQDETVAASSRCEQKPCKSHARVAHANPVQVELGIILDLPAQQALSGAAVKTGEKRRLSAPDLRLRAGGRVRGWKRLLGGRARCVS